MRRHPDCPNTEMMTNLILNRSAQSQPQLPQQNDSNALSAEIQQAIESQSKKPFSDEVRFVKVRMSEQQLIKLMNRGRIYHAVGNFFMYSS